jgi:hypothetical protein
MPDLRRTAGASVTTLAGKACVPEAFAHPAKFSRALIQRIYQHALQEGWLVAGESTVVDCFGGVSLGALDAALAGVRHISIELEPKFHELAQANIALWERKYGHLPQWVRPVCLQGDSRMLAAVLQGAEADGIVSSPPWVDSLESQDTTFQASARPGRTNQCSSYGTAPGQLGAWCRAVSRASSSASYARSSASGNGIDQGQTHGQSDWPACAKPMPRARHLPAARAMPPVASRPDWEPAACAVHAGEYQSARHDRWQPMKTARQRRTRQARLCAVCRSRTLPPCRRAASTRH